MDPKFISPDDVTEDFLKEEKEVLLKQMEKEDKPEDIKEKIISGKIDKLKTDAALLSQAFIKDEKKTVEQLITDSIAKLGENIQIGEFTRFEI
jgi:elongation factor Ts